MHWQLLTTCESRHGLLSELPAITAALTIGSELTTGSISENSAAPGFKLEVAVVVARLEFMLRG